TANPSPPSFPTRRSSDLIDSRNDAHRVRRDQHPRQITQWKATVDRLCRPESALQHLDRQPRPTRGFHRRYVQARGRTDEEGPPRSEEHTSELQSRENLVC